MPVPPLIHDLLSEYEFPGGGRLRNYIFVARPEQGVLVGRDVTLFVSLLRNGNVEIRVLAGATRDCAPEDCEARRLHESTISACLS